MQTMMVSIFVHFQPMVLYMLAPEPRRKITKCKT